MVPTSASFGHGSLVCGLWSAGGGLGGSVLMYVLGTFYIRFFCTWATVSLFWVKPTVPIQQFPTRRQFCCGTFFPAKMLEMSPAPTTSQKHKATHLQVCRLQKRYNFFKANNLLIAKFPRPSSLTSNTVDKLNKSMLSGLVNIITLVLPLVRWWCCCYCLFLRQWRTASLTTVVAVEAVAARRQRQRRRWRNG